MIEIYTDGASRGNPGEGAIAFVFVEHEKVILFKAEYIGKTTNNVAEYRAMISALSEAINKNIKEVILTSDSKLVISQIKGVYKIKAEHLKKLNEKIKELSLQFDRIDFKNVKRENRFISIADKLCNTILNLS